MTIVVILVSFHTASRADAATDPNLVPNPSFETAGGNGLPANWGKGGYGTNDRAFTYPVSGYGGGKAARVEVKNYTSGDAKWYFAPVSVTPLQALLITDEYRSDATSYVTVQIVHTDGRITYADLGKLDPSSTWTKFTGYYTPPADTVKVSVFHVIKSTGFLETDDFFVGTTGPNLVPNPTLSTKTDAGLPANWQKGGYGANDRSFTYPVTGYDDGSAVRVDIGSYSSGDAKWYFASVPVKPLQPLKFEDHYRSDRESYVTIQVTHDDGSNTYVDLAKLAPASSWTSYTGYYTPPADASSLTVFHLIKGVGFLETDGYFLAQVLSDPNRFDRGYVSLMFDDGVETTYKNAFPILDAANFKVDTFIITDRLKDGTYPGYVKAADVIAMQNAGHEIGAHTRSHPDLTTLSPADAKAEIEGSRNDLLAIGAKPVNFFAYPYGAYNTPVIDDVKAAGFLGARSSDGGYNLKTGNQFALRRISMDRTTTLADVKQYVETAKEDKTWVIFLFHDVDDSGSEYAVSPALFKEIVDYLQSAGVTPITMSKGISLMNQ
ncbi:MAG TPA: polysaccharide deacetylase family protein [Candidatus Paceibacterota bacterium]|nr:polysaccharide deacetylase family protein [Candidatus Paceibacterota bacterium]